MDIQKIRKEAIITLFTADSEYNKEKFGDICKFLFPSYFMREMNEIQHNLLLVALAGKINTVLRKYGLLLKSKNYYSSFYVIKDGAVFKEVARYKSTATTMHSFAEVLDAGAKMRQQLLALKN